MYIEHVQNKYNNSHKTNIGKEVRELKTIIIYATKSGASKECAAELAKNLPDATIVDGTKATPELQDFDNVILGTGVRMGKIYSPMAQLIQKNLELLLSKNVSIFLCNASPETFDKTVAQNIPDQLACAARQIRSLGGRPPFRKTPMEEWFRRDEFDLFVENCKL